MNALYAGLVAWILIQGFLIYCRQPGKAGAVGKAIREADWMAWSDARDELLAAKREHSARRPPTGKTWALQDWEYEGLEIQRQLQCLEECQPQI